MRFPIRLPWANRDEGSNPQHLGELELALLERIWKSEEASVRDIHRDHTPRLAYTTLMTTLDRLYKKGFLNRRLQGRAFYYSPAITRSQFSEGLARQVVDFMLQFGEHPPAGIFSCFVDAVTESDSRLLDELERVVKNKRREKRRSE
jgi:predicted transcriptional regulator